MYSFLFKHGFESRIHIPSNPIGQQGVFKTLKPEIQKDRIYIWHSVDFDQEPKS